MPGPIRPPAGVIEQLIGLLVQVCALCSVLCLSVLGAVLCLALQREGPGMASKVGARRGFWLPLLIDSGAVAACDDVGAACAGAPSTVFCTLPNGIRKKVLY